jgi:hypothetical protein
VRTPAAAAADCERRDDWFLEQDVNAWTALAYVAAGVLVIAVVVRRALPRAFVAFGVLAAGEGAGSLLFHGGSGRFAEYLHDGPLIGIVGFMAGWHAGRLHRPGDAATGSLVGAGIGLVAGVVASAVEATSAVAAVLGLVVATAEFVARRRGLPRVWSGALIVLAAVSAATWFAGRTDSAVCDEQSWLQPHGLWHVLSALVLVGWFASAATTTAPSAGAQNGVGTDRDERSGSV